MRSEDGQRQPGRPGQEVMGVISVVLFAHLFIVVLTLSGNLAGIRSQLHQRLISQFTPYARTLNLDPDGVRLYTTHGEIFDDDQFLEIELRENAQTASENIISLPGDQSAWTMQHRRLGKLAHTIGMLAQQDNDEATSMLARGVGNHFLRKDDKQFSVVRSKLHETQPRDLTQLNDGYPDDPSAPIYQQVMYEADVFLTDEGQVEVVKKSASRETATVERGAVRRPGRSNNNNQPANGDGKGS